MAKQSKREKKANIAKLREKLRVIGSQNTKAAERDVESILSGRIFVGLVDTVTPMQELDWTIPVHRKKKEKQDDND